jgi:predicted phage terminase large subunit-like protein
VAALTNKNNKPRNVPYRKVIKPQAGPQEDFLSIDADIIIYGGAAGSGKSFAILLEALRYVTSVKDFFAVFFRKNATHIRNPGGLWDESMKLYPLAGGQPVATILEWRWPKGGKVKMGHLEYENSVLDWQGSQIPLIVFDELTHFSQAQFFYMLSRNRSVCGVKPYVRATTNPDSESWVAEFIAWWIDQETGYPIPERGGAVRWFIRVAEAIVWADSRQELIDKYGKPDLPDDHEDQVRPKSMTFIPAKLSDNKALTDADPDYKANLMALTRVERERLLHGNWKVRTVTGMYFKRSECTIVDTVPDDLVKLVRAWDLAATEPSEANKDPDWTAGVLIAVRKNGKYIVLDCIHERFRSAKVRELVKRVAINDSRRVKVHMAIDPGQAGKEQGESYTKELAGFSITTERISGDKVTRAEPFSAQWQAGNVDVLRGVWNEAYFSELEAFGLGTSHDDQVDASADAFNALATNNLSTWMNLGRG